MADVRPFPGIRYNDSIVRELSLVVTQPYDKISPKMQEEYYHRHPLSFVRLILPKGDSPYTESALTCKKWLMDGTLIRDQSPALYVLHEEFEYGGRRLTRRGFIGAVRVEEFEKGTVLPHEFTLPKAKTDRLNMLRATQMDYEQIFMLYSDPGDNINNLLSPDRVPDLQATDEYGVVHRLWVVCDRDKQTAVQQLMSDKVLLIADGHHRYETALIYRQERERGSDVPTDAALRFKTAAFVNMADPSLVILPTHRLVHSLPHLDLEALLSGLGQFFDINSVPVDEAALALRDNADTNSYLLYAGGNRCWLLRLKDQSAIATLFPADRSADYRRLDVSVLHSIIVERVLGIQKDNIEAHVRYERYWDEALHRVDSGENQLALLMNPTRAEQVRRLAEHGERMPQKSTDFYPKLISGLVFMDVSDSKAL